MIRRKLLIATAIIASAGITACSDMTAPKKLVPGSLPAAAILAPPQVSAADREGNREHVTVVATIYGRGTSEMTPPGLLTGKTVFYTNAKGVRLLSDHSATGHFTCIDVFGKSSDSGNLNGDVTSWSRDPDGSIVLNITNVTFIPFGPDGKPGTPEPATPLIVTIQKFGGAGVGHWTMVQDGFLWCFESVTSGRIVIFYREEDDRDHGGDRSGR
ncbi:MAG: hypothetical protein M3Z54_00810 [Gemmatimonadota bacterium]|nr:hypothetical protein [Gemmatimonadota bacterium]